MICGMPTPLTTRVVQIEPGPMPTLIASAPAAIRSRAAFFGRDVPDDQIQFGKLPLHFLDRFEHARGMSMRRIDGDDVHFRAHQLGRAFEKVAASRRSRRRRAAGPDRPLPTAGT